MAAALEEENTPFKPRTHCRTVWDKENITPQCSPVKRVAQVDIEEYKLDPALFSLCSPGTREKLGLFESFTNRRSLKEEKSALVSSKERCLKLSPGMPSNVNEFRKSNKAENEGRNKAKIQCESIEENKSAEEEIMHDVSADCVKKSVSESVSQIEDFSEKVRTDSM